VGESSGDAFRFGGEISFCPLISDENLFWRYFAIEKAFDFLTQFKSVTMFSRVPEKLAVGLCE
jgi:hypothetical protein